MYIGIGEKALFQLNYELFYYLLPRIWIKSLWEFYHHYNIHITELKIDILLQRIGDKYLIEVFSL